MIYQRERIDLSNDLRVVLDHRDSSQSIAIACLVGAGSRHDLTGKHGIAHVVEHFLFRSHWKDEKQSLFQAIQNYGGQVLGFTGLDYTGFGVYVHRDEAEEALEILATIVTDLPESEELFELEKRIIREELNIVGEDNAYAVQRVKFVLLGGDESLRHLAGGQREHLERLQLRDVQEFYRTFYVSKNMVLSLVGHVEREKLLPRIEKLFSLVPAGSAPESKKELSQKGPKIYAGGMAPNPFISIFYRCPSYTSESLPVLELVADIFSTGLHSRLFQRLREKEGLVYTLESDLRLSSDIGTLDIYTTTSRGRTQQVVKAVIEETMNLISSFTEQELEREKKRFIKQQVLFSEDVKFMSIWYADRELLSSRRNPDDLGQWIARVKDITMEDFLKMARQIFSAENFFMYVFQSLFSWQKWWLKRKVRKMLRNRA
ncbi:MAG: insulinase family protein [Candidatus Aureabacteria bacterium]|nr:insulinase family protein [Candidatus Auribacterota bacterium]